MSLDLTDDKSTLVQEMAWCRQATSHYLSQCCPVFCRHMVSLGPNELRPEGRIRLLAHYNIIKSFIMQSYLKASTYQMLVRYIYICVWHMCLTLNKFSKLFFTQYIGLCVFSLPISHVMIVRVCVLDLINVIKSEILFISHCLGLSHETIVCAVCPVMFLWDKFDAQQVSVT